MTMPADTTNPAPPAGQGGQPSGGDGGTAPKMLTEEEHNRRMRGKDGEVKAAHRRIAELEAAAKQREESQLAEQGKDKELAALREKERDDAIKERDALREWKQIRVSEIEASNKERMKDLPDDFRKRIPGNMDPFDLANLLSGIQALALEQGDGVFQGGPRPKTQAQDMTDDEFLAASNKAMLNARMGRRETSDRGVVK